MEIAGSARRRGVDDEDIRHAVRVPFRRVRQGDDRVLIIGPDRTGRLLEVVVIDPEGDPAVIHAMSLRRKFYDYL
ncbi:MAG: hypothetical protein M3493_02735 [Actinomycetota bacterium]|nr:hypothetical protein [Euzebyaceae bacterium]MDQ3451608.1 hypothetical protein [Actinomycetota bacterium]